MAEKQGTKRRTSSLHSGDAFRDEPKDNKKMKNDPHHTTTTASGYAHGSEGTDPDHPVRVYADGIYDLFHFGHARSLEQAKKLFPNTYLIVGVCNDELTNRLKGKTVMKDVERAESLRHCRWVDEVVENAPWIVTMDFIEKHKIDYVAHGEDIILGEDGQDIYKLVKDNGKYKTIRRTDGISTSDLILRIVRDYDNYVRRNLARGYTGKQMNVSYVKQKQIEMQDNINKIKKEVNDKVEKVRNWSKSRGVRLTDFIQRFGGRAGWEDNGSDSEEFGGFTPDRGSPMSPDRLDRSTDRFDRSVAEEEEEPPHV